VGFAAGAVLLELLANATPTRRTLVLSEQYAAIATGIVTYVYSQSGAQMSGVSKDDGSRGQVAWFTNTWVRFSVLHQARSATYPAASLYIMFSQQDSDVAFYGDNDGTVFLSSVVVAGLQRSAAFNRQFLEHLFGAVRTTGLFGFRPARVERTDYVKNGWGPYFNGSMGEHCCTESGIQPHYQANMHAQLILGGFITGKHSLFIDKVHEALRRLMAAFPDAWHWTEYMSEELAHMLLPLSWLYRVRRTPEVLGWLQRIAADLISHQRPCGAISEYLGPPGLGDLPPPDNAGYGKGEGSLIQSDDDPAADLLYTQNFALMSLHEAYAATGDPALSAARDKLIDFFVRVQATVDVPAGSADAVARLNGTWFRGFDIDKWEYWASTTDWAYGPWETENGWTVGWVTATISLRALNSSFWDASAFVAETIQGDEELIGTICQDFLGDALCV
jgi:hypothetical protein